MPQAKDKTPVISLPLDKAIWDAMGEYEYDGKEARAVFNSVPSGSTVFAVEEGTLKKNPSGYGFSVTSSDGTRTWSYGSVFTNRDTSIPVQSYVKSGEPIGIVVGGVDGASHFKMALGFITKDMRLQDGTPVRKEYGVADPFKTISERATKATVQQTQEVIAVQPEKKQSTPNVPASVNQSVFTPPAQMQTSSPAPMQEPVKGNKTKFILGMLAGIAAITTVTILAIESSKKKRR
jgi:hypothetical protein